MAIISFSAETKKCPEPITTGIATELIFVELDINAE
jgi:hypothetical protein